MRAQQRVLDRFIIERLAEEGGMGVIYRGRDETQDTPVAIKVLRARGAEPVERFLRESELLSELHHEAIVEYIAHGDTEDGQKTIVMEWLEGEDLGRRLRQGPLSVPETVMLAERVADALGSAHARGIVHRDVKPSNLFLVDREVGAVKLLDFGVARLREHAITMSGVTFGTPGYMAPEQARGDRHLDARADVFALGCVLFECLTGRLPFSGDHLMAILAKILLEDAPRVREFAPQIPRSLDQLIGRMLAKDPELRPADGLALAEQIRQLALHPSDGGAASIPPEPSLTTGEQRLLCVVLAGGARPRLYDETRPWTASRPLDRDATPRQKQPNDRGDEAAGEPRPTPSGPTPPSPTPPGPTPPGPTPPSGEPITEVMSGASLEAIEAHAQEREDFAARFNVREVLSAQTAERLRAAAALCDARVEVLADGSVIATLSGSESVVDLVGHAARVALTLRGHLADVPIVVTTGRGMLAGKLPVGDAIDRAARLLRTAAPPGDGRVIVDEVTAGLLDTRFDVTNGSEGGFFFRVEREMPGVLRTLLGKPTPFVGRHRELLTLEAVYAECIEDSVARAVLVSAPAGVGKSRLAHEFIRRLAEHEDPPEVWVARGDPLSAGSPLSLIAQALSRSQGLNDAQNADSRRNLLRAKVAARLPLADAPRVSEFLGELVSAPFSDADSVQLRAARQDAILMGDQIRRAWEDFLQAECAARPVLLILEDLQWGDLPSVKLVDGALRHLRDQPFMVLSLARPEVHAAFPELWRERALSEIRLGELSKKAAGRLVRHVLGLHVTQDDVDTIVGRAEGNAFCLEELLRSVSAGGQASDAPPTVLAMVQARLERLSQQARLVLRAASVFGQLFWQDALRPLCAAELDAAEIASILTELVESELILRHAQSRLASQEELMFPHALIRDAAYATLTDDDRKLGHRLAGQWLMEAGESDAMILGEHFERGGAKQDASSQFVKAAEQALEGNDFAAAVVRATRARELLGDDASDSLVGITRLLEAEAHRWRGEHRLAEPAAHTALRKLRLGTPSWYQAASELALALGRLGDPRRLLEIAESFFTPPVEREARRAFIIGGARTAISLFYANLKSPAERILAVLRRERSDSLEDPVVSAVLSRAEATACMSAGDASGYLVHLTCAETAYRQAGDLRNGVNSAVNTGHALSELGAWRRAHAVLSEALSICERLALPAVQALAKHNLGLAEARTGDAERGQALEREAAALFREQGDRRLEAACYLYEGIILRGAGQPRAALAVCESAAELGSGAPGLAAHARAVHALCLLDLGDVDLAEPLSAEADATLEKLGSMEEGDTAIRIARAKVQLARGNRDAAERTAREAWNRLEDRAIRIANEELRASFLALPEHDELRELRKRLDAGEN